MGSMYVTYMGTDFTAEESIVKPQDNTEINV